MLFDAALPQVPLTDVVGIAEAAERMGFAGLWTSETQHDPFLPCTLIAQSTTRLQFGTAIAVSFARSPTNLAHVAWDLAAQSRGRFILGLGTQVKAHIERRFGLPWPDSVTGKLREQITAIRALWDCWQHGTKLNFRGDYYKLTLMSPFFNPGPVEYPDIPIYIAGVNPGLATLAGELCNGFLVHPFHSPRYLREVIQPAIQTAAQRSGRHSEAISMVVTAFVALDSEALEHARSQLAFYASTPSYRPVMELHGWGETAKRLSIHAARGEWNQMPPLLTDEMLDEFCLQSDSSNLAEALKERYAGIAARLMLYNAFIPRERDAQWKQLVDSFA